MSNEYTESLPPGYLKVPQPFSITFASLGEFLDYWLGIKDKVIAGESDLHVLAAIKKHPNWERECVIEEYHVEGKKNLYWVWRRQEWETDNRRNEELKNASETERQRGFKRKEQIALITAAMLDTFPDPEAAEALAAKWYRDKNKGAIAQFYNKEVEFV
jgi:hypothetical protein